MDKDDQILPHTRTMYGISVDPEAALDSALRQLGSGTKLPPDLLEKFKQLVLKHKKKSNE
jgi:hypothetical protein